MSNAAILLAGGKGSRMRGSVKDKVLAPLLGMPVILHSFGAFLQSGAVEEIVFVCRDDVQAANIKSGIKKFFPKAAKLAISYTHGGAERQDSVLNGLQCVTDKSGLVFIHDGARPMICAESVAELAETAAADGAAVLASRVVDTIKKIPEGKGDLHKCALQDMDRSRLWAMQTPQVFKGSEILSAYEKVKREGLKITDDVAAAAVLGVKVSIVENHRPNPKITVPEDIALIEFIEKKNLPAKAAAKKAVKKVVKKAPPAKSADTAAKTKKSKTKVK